MSNLNIEKILERERNARNGPWKSFVEGRDHTSGSDFIMVGYGKDRNTDIELLGATTADQDFIANSRQDIPMLIEEIFRLRRLLEQHDLSY